MYKVYNYCVCMLFMNTLNMIQLGFGEGTKFICCRIFS